MCDPFNYIAAIFTPEKTEIGYGVAYILRIFTAGLSMNAFLNHHGMRAKKQAIGAFCYAFCTWAVGVRIHSFFVLPLILFPLVILGIDMVFEKKKPYLLIISVFFSLITYVYFAYMTAIGAGIYIVFKWFLEKHTEYNKTVKDCFKLFAKLVIYVLIAVFLSAIVLAPIAYSILNASKASGATGTDWFMDIKQVFRFFTAFTSNTQPIGNYSFIGVSAFLLALFPKMFYSIKIKSQRLPGVLTLLFLVLSFFPLWGRIMNGFSYAAGRWCYIFAFFAVWSTVNCIDNEEIEPCGKKYEIAKIVWVIFLICGTIAGLLVTASSSIANVAIGLFNVVCMILFMYVEPKKNYLLLGAICIQMGLFYFLVFSPFLGDGMKDYLDEGKVYSAYNNSVLRVTSNLDQNYRIDFAERARAAGGKYSFTCLPPNEELYWKANTLRGYLSTLSNNVHLFSEELNNYCSINRRTAVDGFDERLRLNTLLGVKYFLYTENTSNGEYLRYGYEDTSTIDGVSIKEAKYDVSLGYFFENAIAHSEYSQYSSLYKEQILMDAVVIEDDDFSSAEYSEYINEAVLEDDQSYELTYTVSDTSEIQIENNAFVITEANKTLTLSVEDCENCEIYMEILCLEKEAFTAEELIDQNITNKTSVYDASKILRNYIAYKQYGDFEVMAEKDGITKRFYNAGSGTDNQANAALKDFCVNFGYYDKTTGNITLTFKTAGKYSFDSIKIYAIPAEYYDKQAESLTSNRLDVTAYESNTLEGRVNAGNNGVLFISLPYSPGWTAYVDGVEATIIQADICYMGIPLSAGEHEIKMIYRPIGFNKTIILTVVGLIMLILVVIFEKRKKQTLSVSYGNHKVTQ